MNSNQTDVNNDPVGQGKASSFQVQTGVRAGGAVLDSVDQVLDRFEQALNRLEYRIGQGVSRFGTDV